MGNRFVFLNISDAPGLGAAEAKRMRAHVTKTNFAKRRRRIAKQVQDENFSGEKPYGPTGQLIHRHNDPVPRQVHHPLLQQNMAVDAQISTPPTDSEFCLRSLLREMRAFVFPAGLGAVNGLTEALWVNLLLSEPALLNASMGIKLEYYEIERNAEIARRAAFHTLEAIRLINARISATSMGLSDGMLGAVFTLAIGARLANSASGWTTHVEGLSQMITLRRCRGNDSIPQWFSDVVLYDAISEIVLSSPNHNHHAKIVAALEGDSGYIIAQVRNIWDRMIKLQEFIIKLNRKITDEDTMKSRIQSQIDQLHQELEVLEEMHTPYIRAFVYSVELYLYITWPHETRRGPEILAEDLRESLGQPHARPCSSIQLKIWQLFVCAAATESQSIIRERVLISLEGMLRSVRMCAWQDLFPILKRVCMPSAHVLCKFRTIWDQLKMS